MGNILKNKRSNYLIDKSFQINFIVKFIIMIVICAIFSGLVLAVWYYIRYDMVINEGAEVLIKYIKPKIPEKQSYDGHTPAIDVGGQKYVVRFGTLYLLDDKTLFPTYSPLKYTNVGGSLFVYPRNSRIIRPVKQLNYRVKKGQVVEQRTPGTPVCRVDGKQYAVRNGRLYMVEDQIMYPTYHPARYRIVKQDDKNILQEYRKFQEKFVTVESLTYTLKEGKLGQLLTISGKESFRPVKPTIPIEVEKGNIDENNIRGVTDRFQVVLFALLVITIIFIVTTIIFGILFSHRLAGPIYRIGVSIDRMAAGDFDFNIRLRRTDAFQHIAQKLNTLMYNLRNGIVKVKGSGSKTAGSKKATTGKKSGAKKTTRKKSSRKKS